MRRHHVAWKLDIDRERALTRRAQYARDLGRRGRRIVQHRLVAGDFAEDRKLGINRAGLVMQQEAAGTLARARRARDHHDRRTLRIGAGDRIHHVEGAGTVGDDRDAEARVVACRRVRREADCRLVAECEMRKDAAFLDHLEQRQHEIAGNPEDFACAMVLESLQERGRESRHARD